VSQREPAVRALIRITEEGGYANLVLGETLKRNSRLPPEGRALVTELVYGVLRNLIYLDYVLNIFSNTPVKRMKPFILNVLRTAAYQILFMDKIPPSAACNEAVAMTKSSGYKDLAGFVNGVLRSIACEAGQEPSAGPKLSAGSGRLAVLQGNFDSALDYLSIKYSYPKWILELWLREFSIKEIEGICAAGQLAPPVSVCVNTTKTTAERLCETLRACCLTPEQGQLCENALLLRHTSRGRPSGDIAALASFKDGWFHVMDQGAMLAAERLDARPGEYVMDVCAAPGGKAFYTACRMNNTGTVLALDIHPQRYALLKEGAGRLGLSNIQAGLADASVFDPGRENAADRLIIDAPCSGLGVLGSKPDIRYARAPGDVAALAALQRSILSACWRYVKPGGLLVYTTCTISAPENQENAEWFLKNHPFEQSGDFIQLLPGDTGGFFICAFRRL
jgi:16S rRNA (cytosine967-C5)-methyltransferase